jgi:hypothetical protein
LYDQARWRRTASKRRRNGQTYQIAFALASSLLGFLVGTTSA